MLNRDYPDQACSIARALEVVGERWTLLIVRDVLLGVTRFDDLVASLGVTRTVLSGRLDLLVAEGVLERAVYQEHPLRHAYAVTEKGRALRVVLAALLHWGDTYYPRPEGPPRLMRHHDCGGEVTPALACAACDGAVPAAELAVVPGPGLRGRERERAVAP